MGQGEDIPGLWWIAWWSGLRRAIHASYLTVRLVPHSHAGIPLESVVFATSHSSQEELDEKRCRIIQIPCCRNHCLFVFSWHITSQSFHFPTQSTQVASASSLVSEIGFTCSAHPSPEPTSYFLVNRASL